MEAWQRPIRQECLKGMAAVDGRAIPDDHHPARDLPQQMLQGDHIYRIDGAVLMMKIELALRRDRTEGGDVIAGPPCPQDRRLADRCIGPDDAGQGIAAGFVDKEDGLPLGFRPLLIAGQVWSRPWAMA